MDAELVTRNREGTKGAGAARIPLIVGALAALALAFAGNASAQQYLPEAGESDTCAIASPNGTLKAEKPNGTIRVTVVGGGAVSVAMWGTKAPCITPLGDNYWQVQTVCETHCGHNHSAPYPWTVAIIPQNGADVFHGWSNAACEPIKAAPRNYCIVRMTTDHNLTAHFGQPADTLRPSAPEVRAESHTYAVTLSWSPSVDASPTGQNWIAWYDIHATGVRTPHVARVNASTTSYRISNLLLCDTSYTFRVEAFDWSGNVTSSAPITARTGACPPPIGGGTPVTGPRPDTEIHVKPPKMTTRRNAYFHFGQRGDVKATKYQCKLDRGLWRRCSASTGKRYRSLKKGYHTFRVRAGNANGWDPTPARYTWRIR